jgi:hypothetical protein
MPKYYKHRIGVPLLLAGTSLRKENKRLVSKQRRSDARTAEQSRSRSGVDWSGQCSDNIANLDEKLACDDAASHLHVKVA